MWLELSVGAVLAALGAYGYAQFKRARLYEKLRKKIKNVRASPLVDKWGLPAPKSLGNDLAVVPDFLPRQLFEHLLTELSTTEAIERGYIPIRRKAGTIAYETLIETAPVMTSLYHSDDLRRFLSSSIKVELLPTPIRDQNSLSLLIYDRPGDHIGFHYDYNFYRGRHFTVILCLVNTGTAADGLSHASFVVNQDGTEREIRAAPNTLIMFEGSKVYHRVTPIKENERRVVMSMTFCTEPRSRWSQAVSRRVKDTAFFGLRALWT